MAAGFVGVLSPGAAGADSVEYQLVFEGLWAPEDATESFPAGAHFTALIGATHAPGSALWQPGELASPGIENVAELGSTGLLVSEIDDLILQGLAGSEIRADGIFSFPGDESTTFTIDSEHPEVSLASMVAPSPDWFVGVYALSLRSEDEWVETLTVDLRPWDAGTERGSQFRLGNPASDPHGPVRPRIVPFIDDPVIGLLHFTLLPEPEAAAANLAALLGLVVCARFSRSCGRRPESDRLQSVQEPARQFPTATSP